MHERGCSPIDEMDFEGLTGDSEQHNSVLAVDSWAAVGGAEQRDSAAAEGSWGPVAAAWGPMGQQWQLPEKIASKLTKRQRPGGLISSLISLKPTRKPEHQYHDDSET